MNTAQSDISTKVRGGAKKPNAAPKNKLLSTVFIVVGLLFVSAALTVAMYPFLSSQWEANSAYQQFTAERARAEAYDQETVDSLIADAEVYNAVLAGQVSTDAADTLPSAYDQELRYNGSDVICWLEIPAVDIKLPVYADDGSAEVSADGAEHMRGTSLPVGGASCNTVITAHSGSHAGTSMAFNKLDLLKVGDVVVLWTLGRPYAYEVTGWEQTNPDDMSNMRIREGSDELTLLTCRPIGTTARRLFVHASRTDYVPEVQEDSRVYALNAPDFWQFILALCFAGIVLWILLIVLVRRKEEKKEEHHDCSEPAHQ